MTTNADITIFNRIMDAQSKSYRLIPTTIRGVSLYAASGSSFGSEQSSDSDSYKIRIPIDADTSGKSYIECEAYESLTTEQATWAWTIQKSNLIVLGELSGDYTEQLLKKQYDTITVNNFSDNTTRGSKRVRHWRIGGA